MPPATGIDPVSTTLAAAQGVLGTVQTITGSIKANRLVKQLTAFHTPDEAFKLLNATESMASQGFDAFTLKYMTDNVNRAASGALGTAARLGADPNDLSAILGQQADNILKIGAENHDRNMANFSRYLGALENIGANREAEQISKNNLIKDKIQAAVGDKQAGLQNLQNAANAYISMRTANKTSKLFTNS